MSGLRLNFASIFAHQSFKFIFSFYKMPSLSMPKFRQNLVKSLKNLKAKYV